MIQNEFVAYRRISKYYQAMKQSYELQNKQKKIEILNVFLILIIKFKTYFILF